MSDQAITVPEGLTTEGLLGKRYLARAIDSGVIVVLAIGLLGLLVLTGLVNSSDPNSLLFLAMLVVVWIGYGALLESSTWQATVGKKFMGLRVYDAEGGRLRLGQAALRNLVKDGPFLLIGMIPGGQLLSFVWLGAHLIVLHRSAVYQAIHDRAAKTWVAAPESTIQLRIA